MKYSFADNAARPEFVLIYDNDLNQNVAEIYDEAFRPIFIAYQKLRPIHQELADQFLFGAIMGLNGARLYLEKYPSDTVVVSEGKYAFKIPAPELINNSGVEQPGSSPGS